MTLHMGFPNCIDAIDGTHVSIICPTLQGHRLYKQKGVFLHGVVVRTGDHQDMFTDINAW